MTKKEFDEIGWTGGMFAKFNDFVYPVGSVDFEFNTIGLDIKQELLLEVPYKDIEIVEKEDE